LKGLGFNTLARRLVGALWWLTLGSLGTLLLAENRPELASIMVPLDAGLLLGIALMRLAEHRDRPLEVYR